MLDPAECAAMKAEVEAGAKNCYGPTRLQRLMDHPAGPGQAAADPVFPSA